MAKSKLALSWVKVKIMVSRYWKYGLFAVLGLVIIVAGSIYRHELSVIAASYTWTQTDWSGGASTTATAIHPGNQTGWTQYYSASQVEIATGSVKLQR